MSGNLIEDVLGEETDGECLRRVALALDTSTLRLLVDLGIGLVAIVDDPLSKAVLFTTRSIAACFVISIGASVTDDEVVVDASGETFHPCLNGFLARIGRPFIGVRSGHRSIGVHLPRSLCDLPRQLIIRPTFTLGIAILNISSLSRIGTWRILQPFHLLRLGRILDDEGDELVSHIDRSSFAAGLAISQDFFVLGEDEIGFWVLTGRAQDEFVDEGDQEFSKARSVVSAVDDVAIGFFIEDGLGA